LDEEDRNAALETLLEKIDIFISGAEKRERWDAVESYRFKRLQWEQELLVDSGVDR